MKHLVNQRALGASLLAAALALPAAASAQDAAATAPTPDTQWVKICAPDKDNQPQCNISQVLLAQNGSVVASFSLQPLPSKKIAIGAFVPLGFVIPAGVQLTVDGAQKGVAQFTICVPPSQDGGPAGCAARAEVGEDFIAALKKGNKLGIVLANVSGQQIPIEMSLSGFAKTYDGEGLDPVAARALQAEQSKELQDAARAAFQRMIQKQQAESGAASPN
jgi:invasion protein IalB